MGRSGSIGNIFYIEEDFWPHNTALFVKDFKGNLPKFVYYYLRYFDPSKYSASTAVPTMNRNNLRGITVDVPSLTEQHEIIRRVGLLFERADAFDQEVVAAGRRCERLTQAVLGKAFRGELVREMESSNEIK
jgi:type I restriction enzyme S subunit